MAFLLAAIIHLLVLFNAVIRACFALYGAMSTICQGLIDRANNIIHNGINFKQILPNRATIAKTLFTILIQWLIRPLLSMALRATFNRIIRPMVSMALSTFHRRITRPIHRVFIRPVVWKVTRKLLKIAVFLLAATIHVLIVLKAAVQACLVLYGAVSLTVREIISGARKVIHDGIQFHEILPDRGSIAKTLFQRIPNFWIQWLIQPMVSMVLRVTLRWLILPTLFMAVGATIQRILRPLLSLALSEIRKQRRKRRNNEALLVILIATIDLFSAGDDTTIISERVNKRRNINGHECHSARIRRRRRI